MMQLENSSQKRMKVVGVVIGVDGQNQMIVDDGTGRAFVKFSGSMGIQRGLTLRVGDIVMVIGKTGRVEAQMYIAAELVKKMQNPVWLQVHKKECELSKGVDNSPEQITSVEEKSGKMNSYEGMLEMIKRADKGEGVPVDEVIKKSPAEKGSEMVEMLIRNGEIFEIEPGRVKVLE